MPVRVRESAESLNTDTSFISELNTLSRAIDAALLKRAGGVALASAAALGLGVLPVPALADTFTVNSTTDSGDGTCDAAECTLREAIAAANTNFGPDTVNASGVSGTIALSGTEISVTGPDTLYVNGPPTSDLTVDARNQSRIFSSTGGANLLLRNLILVNGNASGDGGAVYSNDYVHLYDVTIRDSHADGDGGGLYAYEGVDLNGSTISGNSAGGDGGGVASGDHIHGDLTTISNNSAAQNGGGIAIFDSHMDVYGFTVTGNTAGGSGGGIYSNGNEVDLYSSTISNNTADGNGGGVYANGYVALNNGSSVSDNEAVGVGGGIFAGAQVDIEEASLVSGNSAASGGGVYAYAGDLYIDDSTIRDNAATAYYGGGVFLKSGNANIATSTISGNEAASDGGGIFTYNGNVTLTNSTVSGNTAGGSGGGASASGNIYAFYATVTGNTATAGSGGGLHLYNSSYAISLANSIVAGNSAPAGEPDIEAQGTGVSSDYSLIGIYDGAVTGDDNIVGTAGSPASAGLAPLADNGGPTLTHAIDSASDAYNVGDPTPVSPPDYDQRGAPFPRIFGGALDMGAYEYRYVYQPPSGLVVNDLGDPGADSQCTVDECTLREAVVTANILDGPNDITFEAGLTGTIYLDVAAGEMDITGDTTITGNLDAGVPLVKVDAGGESRIFNIHESANDVTIANLALSGGQESDPGGAIYSEAANLVLSGLTLTYNLASLGGAVFAASYSPTGGLTITDSTFTENFAYAAGGALAFAFYDGEVEVRDSEFIGNGSKYAGGGLFSGSKYGSLTLEGNNFEDNVAGGDGGGAALFIGGEVSLSGNTFNNNSAGTYIKYQDGGNGGGLFAAVKYGGTLNLVAGNTFTGNQAFPNNEPCDQFNEDPPIVAGGMGGGMAVVTGLYSAEGSSVYAREPATARITGATFSGNTAHGGIYTPECYGNTPPPVAVGGNGGGLYFFGSGGADFSVSQSTITGNTAEDAGGGVAIYGGSGYSGPVLEKARDAASGKGIVVPEPGAPNYFTVANSTLSGNTATYGGGLAARLADYNNHLAVNNTTISGNSADYAGAAMLNSAPGVYAGENPSTLAFRHATVTDNSVSGYAGGIFTNGFGQAVAISNSIVYNTGDLDLMFTESPDFDVSYSLIGDPGISGVTDGANGNIVGADPLLGPLQNNGGPTDTRALDTSSPAFNAGSAAYSTGLSYDQRGVPNERVVFGAPDMGAYEFQGPFAVSLSIDTPSIPENGGSATLSACLPSGITVPETVVVDLTVAGAAAAGQDHDLANPATVTIPANAACGTVSITALDDTLDEADETVVVDITGLPANYIEGTPNQVTTAIVDDDGNLDNENQGQATLVSLALSVDAIREEGVSAKAAGAKSAHTTELTATLDRPAPGEVTVLLDYSGQAIVGVDFTGPGSVVIPAGELSGFVTLAALDDSEVEGDEPFIATVQGVTCTPDCAVLITDPVPEASGVVVDDDQAQVAAPIPALGPLGLILLPFLIPIAGWRYLRRHVVP